MKKPETKAKETKKQTAKEGDCRTWSVDRVRSFTNAQNKTFVFFSLTINDVSISDCRAVETDGGDFVALPQKQGSDGKWYNVVYFRFSDDLQRDILAEVERQLNEQ